MFVCVLGGVTEDEVHRLEKLWRGCWYYLLEVCNGGGDWESGSSIN